MLQNRHTCYRCSWPCCNSSSVRSAWGASGKPVSLLGELLSRGDMDLWPEHGRGTAMLEVTRLQAFWGNWHQVGNPGDRPFLPSFTHQYQVPSLSATGQDTGNTPYKKVVFLGRKSGNCSSVTVTEVHLGTKGLGKDPLEEGTANLRGAGLASVNKAKERGAAVPRPSREKAFGFGGSGRSLTAQVLSTSREKIRPQR